MLSDVLSPTRCLLELTATVAALLDNVSMNLREELPEIASRSVSQAPSKLVTRDSQQNKC